MLASVLRRWYVALLVLALTGYAAVHQWRASEPQYVSTTAMTVVPSTEFMQVRASSGSASDSSMGNPFGYSAGNTLAALLADSIDNGVVALPPEAAGTVLTVDRDGNQANIFFTVLAAGPTEDAVVLALSTLESQGPQILREIQVRSGSPEDQLYTSLLTRPMLQPSVTHPGRQRAVVGTALAGLLVAALACVALDGSLRSRQRQRRSASSRTAGTREAISVVLPPEEGSRARPVRAEGRGSSGRRGRLADTH